MKDTLHKLIAEQQEGFETHPRFMIGEQLKDMAGDHKKTIELLVQDLQTDGMKLEDAEKHFADYAKKNKGKANTFCITPIVAERLLREFYGLPEEQEETNNETEAPVIDLGSFF